MIAGGGKTGDLFGGDELAAPARSGAAASTDNCLREPLSAVFARVAPAWKPVTDAFLATPEGQSLVRYVDSRIAEGATVYPATVFRALELTPPGEVAVVIVGQDPYH